MNSIVNMKQEEFSPEENNSYTDNLRTSDEKKKTTLVSDALIVFLIMIISGWFIYYLTKPTTLPIKQVNIEGKFNHLSTTYLKELIQDKVRGNFFNIDVEQIRKYLMSEPWVKDVSVQRIWPGELRLIVQEQTATANWNNIALLNETGEIFVKKQSMYQESLPVLQGPEGSEKTVLEKYRELDDLFTPLDISIRQLILSDRRAWSMIIDKNIKINIGRHFLDQRISRLVNLFQEGLSSMLDHIEYIDMRYANGFVIRWKQQNGVLPEYRVETK